MTCMRARTSSNFRQIGPRAAELRPLKDVRNWFLLSILRMHGLNLTKFCIHIIIDKIYIAIVKRHFSQICIRVTALDRYQKLVFAQYLENGWTEFDQILYTLQHWQDLCLYCKGSFFKKFATELQPLIGVRNIMDKVYVVLENCNFSQICNGVPALDWCQNFFFVQYLENEWTEFNQILYTHYYWQDLCCFCKASFFGSDRIRTLVSMATESSHRVVMAKTVSPLFLACFSSNPFHTCR